SIPTPTSTSFARSRIWLGYSRPAVTGSPDRERRKGVGARTGRSISGIVAAEQHIRVICQAGQLWHKAAPPAERGCSIIVCLLAEGVGSPRRSRLTYLRRSRLLPLDPDAF